MNTENENGKHDLNFFLDKQLQQKLLDADDYFLEREHASGLISAYIVSNKFKSNNSTTVCNGNNSNITNKQTNNIGNSGGLNSQKMFKYLHSFHVCGWCPNTAVHYRKSENDVPPRSRAGLGINVNNVIRESLFSRDSKSRPQNLNNFVFRHYADPRKYIEQYRREHACYDTTNSSATKSEFLESRRFYAYNQYSPLAVGCQVASHQPHNHAPQPQPEMHIQSNEGHQKSANQTPMLHYSNRREQQRQNISANFRSKNQHQYKLSKNAPPKSENSLIQDYTEEYIEALEISKKQRSSGSAKERSSTSVNGTSIQKQGATKVNIPAGASVARNTRQISSGSPSELTPSGLFHSHKLGQPGSGPRTLDQLSCVVSTPLDRQSQVQSAAEKNSSSSSKPKSVNALPTRQKNNSSNVPTTSTSASTSILQSSKNPKSNSETVSQFSNNSSHHHGEKKGEKSLPNGSSHFSNGINGPSHFSNGDNGLNHFSNEDKVTDLDASSESSAVSIGCLSTKCLGVEAVVKPRPKLEASCTYHVFPNEFTLSQHQGYTPPLLWNPSKSALEKRLQPPNGASVEFGLPSPFCHSPRARPKTEESKSSRVVEFITKEFVADTKPINLCPDIFKETARLATAPGLKTNTIKPDLPATFALQGFSKRPHFEAFGKKRRSSKTTMARKKKDNKNDKDGGRKSWSASTDASNHSASGNSLKLKPMTVDSGNNSSSNSSTTLAPVPYFKFWNSSLPPKTRDNRRMVADKSCDLTMQQLAQMVLTDGSGDRDQELKEAAKKVLEQHAETDEGHHSSTGIATGDPWITSPISRITQARLLESLCLINQCAGEPVPRPLHLTFIQEDSNQDTPLDAPVPQPRGTVRVDHTNNDKSHANSNVLLKTHNFNVQNKVPPNECNLEISNSTTVHIQEGGAWEKKKQHKSLRELSQNGSIPNYDPSLSTSSSQSQFKSKLKDSINKQWHTKRASLHKKADDSYSSLSHRKKIKHLIEQSRLKNQYGQRLDPAPAAEPEMTLGLSSAESELAVSATSCWAAFPECPSENHHLQIRHCNASASGVVCSPKLFPRSATECMIRKEMDSSREKLDSEKIVQTKTATTVKRTEPVSSMSTMEDIINNLQTSGPSIPPLCGKGFASRHPKKSSGSKRVSKMANLSPLLSHPDIEKLTKHMNVKVQISHMKFSKAGHIKRSQTIHL